MIAPVPVHCFSIAFIKGRYIGKNIRLLFDIIEYTEEHDIPGMLLFTDFEKAFDSINHEYITEILNLFYFGRDLKSWINLFYHSATSCVLYYITNFFPIDRGVRLGCPLSPYIFILGIEIPSIAIRNNQNITGIDIFRKTVKTYIVCRRLLSYSRWYRAKLQCNNLSI